MSENCEAASQRCIDLLREGLELIDELRDSDYTFPEKEQTWSHPGSHTRHIVDFFDCLFAGIDSQRIDYCDRERRMAIEESRSSARLEITRCVTALESLATLDARMSVEVRSDYAEAWTGSTLARELRFVAGHAVHHFALIRLTLARRGVDTRNEFGVAASTLEHRQNLNGLNR